MFPNVHYYNFSIIHTLAIVEYVMLLNANIENILFFKLRISKSTGVFLYETMHINKKMGL